MCGVAALFAHHDAAPAVDPDELRRVLDAMATRGPDDAGSWRSGDGRVALGHLRLALVDPGPGGAQPRVGADGQVALAWNGEIYNHAELRARLTAEGVRFEGRGDTEVLLRLYEARGEAAFRELRGMFAVVIHDARRRTLVLARDPYGVKPLYLADDGWTARVASQVSALVAGGRISREIDPAARAGFLLTGSVPEPFTTYRDVQAVPPGTVVRVDGLGVRAPRRFADVREVLAEVTGGASAVDLERAHAAVGAAVRGAAVADAKVGVFLSDGVDSGVVLRHAAAAGAPPPSLTVRFEEGAGDDAAARIAARTARACGSEHLTYVVTGADFARDLPCFLERMDQPTIDGANVWYASRAARDAGWKAALTGVGGDELFGGYESFRDVPRWARLAAIPGRVPGLGAALRRVTANVVALGLPPKAPGLLEYARSVAGAWLLRRAVFMPWELSALIGRDAAREGLARLAPLRHIRAQLDPMPGTDYGKVAVLESCLYLRNQLLRDADWAAMAHSVEVRVPFADPLLAAEVLPWLARDGRDKGRLHRTAPMPRAAACSARRKRGFHVPYERWLETVPDLDAWRRVPALRGSRTRYARRLAYAVADAKGLL